MLWCFERANCNLGGVASKQIRKLLTQVKGGVLEVTWLSIYIYVYLNL